MWPLFEQKAIVSITCCVAMSRVGTCFTFRVLALILIPTCVTKFLPPLELLELFPSLAPRRLNPTVVVDVACYA